MILFLTAMEDPSSRFSTWAHQYRRRISKGNLGHSSKEPITLLRDGDQPFEFDIRFFDRPYRFAFSDTASPEEWKLLNPHVVVLCYDISSRLSLINVQRLVSSDCPPLISTRGESNILPVDQRNQDNLCRENRFTSIIPRLEERFEIGVRSKWYHLSSRSV